MENEESWPPEGARVQVHVPAIGPARAVRLALMLATLLAALWPAGTSFATPTPPVILVNHETRECSEVIQGDDCSWCDPPAGWEVLGGAGQVSCPDGYAEVDAPAMDCRRYETPFCCSGGVHRGDCEDMVIDEGAETCGFVDEIEGCALPENWLSRPSDVEAQDWACPAGYSWLQEEVACLAATAQATDAVPVEDDETPWRGICFGLTCLILVAVMFGFAAMFPIWYVSRQKERRMLPPSSKK